MELRKACVCGHFGFGKTLLNGQTIKTQIFTNELDRILGEEQVLKLDTHGGVQTLLKMFVQVLIMLKKCKNFIIFPANNGLRFLVPLMIIYNVIFKRRLHYVVIGGWLTTFLKDKKLLARQLKKFDGIYVETNAMKTDLEEMGFDNVFVMPNCKSIKILREDELVFPSGAPYRLCTFSRVMKEKGIETAVRVVKDVNEKYRNTIFSLDVYGQVDENQLEWFDEMQNNFPNYVKYGGVVSFDKSTDVLKNYTAMLFPTYYEGEGFAGTLIDAMAAGVPVIASDWKYNSEIISGKEIGVVYPTHNMSALKKLLEDIYDDIGGWNSIKINCLREAKKYQPEEVIKVLCDNLG